MRLDTINFIRACCAIVVVFFHVYVHFFKNGVFGAEEDGNLWYVAIWCGPITVAMPMFFFLSGYCFTWSAVKKGHYNSFTELLRKKSLRLLVPYFVWSVVMMLSCGGAINVGYLVRGINTHLWFLPSLFWCFLFGYVLLRRATTVYHWLICLLLAFAFMMSGIVCPRVFGLLGASGYLCWFIAGQMFCMHYDKFSVLRGRVPVLLLMLVPWVVMTVLSPARYEGAQTFWSLLTVALVLVSSVFLADKVSPFMTKVGGGSRAYELWRVSPSFHPTDVGQSTSLAHDGLGGCQSSGSCSAVVVDNPRGVYAVDQAVVHDKNWTVVGMKSPV